MPNQFDSYCAGVLDTCRSLKIDVPDGMNENDFKYPNEDAGELDKFEYLKGQVYGILLFCLSMKIKE